mmetsp:Transcript_8327/g.30760  ORF Transcript_8327/g.30760 Transcript_8327/m.30760 type:complete len:658 (-) Transcript_8327:32-2005(-)|eukprot:CAMPEP_0117444730 /NCGR_PEP_ID=MMETSP0759-20121206/5402_1 /TAXON_ID=63605 /ORGANISM="Percolomonas cosmopolitus, Strain WS" /LENGTH=657 /DNA_ID=CAMNT_0005236827 /DNA_START=169 /DNA_END=2142 /DNA_ORIENTATION=+
MSSNAIIQFIKNYEEKCVEQHIEPLRVIQQLQSDNGDSEVNSQHLNLSELTIGAKNTIAVAHALGKDSFFSHVDLSESYMGDSGCKALAQALQHNRTVKVLNLKGANIQAAGANALGLMLKKNSTLETLILEWNGVGMLQSGMGDLAMALNTNTTLANLDLRNNKVSAEGAAVLGAMLKKNRTLLTLDLRWNNLGSSGGKHIEEALQENNTIIELPLSGNEIDYKVLQNVEQLLMRNKEIRLSHEKERVLSQKIQRQLHTAQETQTKKLISLEKQLESQNSEYSKEIVEKEQSLESLKMSLQNERQVTQSLETKLRDVELTSKQKVNEIDILKKYHKEEVDTLKKKIEKLETLQEQTGRMLDQTTTDLSSIKERHDTLKTEFANMQTENRRLKDQMEAKESANAKLKASLEKYVDTGANSQSKLMESQRRIENLEKQVESLKKVEEEYQSAKNTLHATQQSFEETQLEAERQHKAEINRLEREWEDKFTEEQKKSRKLESKIRLLKNEITEMTDMNEKLQKDFERRLKQMADSQESGNVEKSRLQTQNDQFKLEIKQQNYTISNLQKELNNQSKENETKLQRLTQQLDTMIAQHKKDSHNYEDKLATANESIDILTKEVRQLKYENATLKEENNKRVLDAETQIHTFLKERFDSLRM